MADLFEFAAQCVAFAFGLIAAGALCLELAPKVPDLIPQRFDQLPLITGILYGVTPRGLSSSPHARQPRISAPQSVGVLESRSLSL